MSCSPCGYSYTSAPQILMTGQHPTIPYPSSNSVMPPETLVSQTHPGAGLCSIPYDTRLLGPSAYSRLSELYPGYPDPVAASYMTGHPAMIYPSSLASPYDLKDPRAAWAQLPQTAGYDPILAAYSPYGDRFDPVDSEARRRNATRETTSTLKAWLNEHRKNPYPTKGEKIMLAIITKMTLTQVSTWFANARRRLKKENKMTWEPRNKTGDDLDDVSADEDDEKEEQNGEDPKSDASDTNENQKNLDPEPKHIRRSSTEDDNLRRESSPYRSTSDLSVDDTVHKHRESSPPKLPLTDLTDSIKSDGIISPEKPKIWSLAQTATSDSPPNPRKHALDHHHQHQTDIDSRLRRSYGDHRSSPYHRNISRLSQDSSAESSLSSPPLWRSTDLHSGFTPSDKFGRVTPLDSNDFVSASPSSTGSPVIVPPSLEQSSRVSPSVNYNRLMGSRFMPCGDAVPRHSPMDFSQFYASQVNSMASPLDIRTFHPTFIRSSPFPYPVGFTCAPTAIYHNPAITTLTKTKIDEGNPNRCES